MAEQFYTILTNVGKAKVANSLPTGTKVNLTKLKIGDSNGTYYNPSETQTDLVHKVYECNVTSVEVDEDNPSWVTITAAIPSDVGGFMIREVGVFDDGNNLIAIGKYPETYKPVASDGSTKELYIKMTLEITNSSSVELKIDPTVIIATKKDIQILDNSISSINASLSEKANDKTVRFKDDLFLTKILNHTPSSSTVNVLEGFCIIGNYLIFALIDNNDANATICKYDLTTYTLLTSVSYTNLKHANDMCYVPSNNLIYVATDGGTSVVTLNADTLDYVNTVTFPVGVGAIGYDIVNSQFVIRNYADDYFYILDSSLNVVSSFYNKEIQTEQGLYFNDGIIYMTYFEAGTNAYGQTTYNALATNTSAIIAFDAKGNNLKTWYVGQIGEIESIEIYQNKFLLGFNGIDDTTKHFYKAEFRSNEMDMQSLTTLEVQKNTYPLYSGDTLTIYCDSTRTGVGQGTLDNPFSKFKDAIEFIYNCKTKANFVLELNGNFENEGNICIAGVSKRLFINGNNAKINSLIIDGCKFVRLTSINITNVSSNTVGLYIDCSIVDVRTSTIQNTNSAANALGIKSYDSTLYFCDSLANTIRGFAYGIYCFQSTILYHCAQIFDNNTTNIKIESSICKCDPTQKTNITNYNSQFLQNYDTIVGSLSMQCTTGGTTTTQIVTIPNATSILFASCNAGTSAPQNIHACITGISGNTFTIAFNRTDTTATEVRWMALVKYN